MALLIAAHALASEASASEVSAADPSFTLNQAFLTPPEGMATIGGSHGDIAVAPTGEIYVSVEDGEHPGIQVYGADGHYLRNVPNAPNDFHGFVIATPAQGTASLYGASLRGQRILQLALDGKVLLEIPATSIPDQYKTRKDGQLSVALTGIAVAPGGDIFVVDGYGRDFIHRFDKTGRYLATFGGKEAPWNFNNCHKIAMDPRFTPTRLLCTDRFNDRLIHLSLDGDVLGIFAQGLRWPSALAVYRNELAVADLGGRVAILGLKGELIASIGTNDNANEIKTNQVAPAKWAPNLFYAPHGITYDPRGNLLVTEWNQWGRVVRVNRR